ncbi:MAG: hypothetical protein EOP18_10115, partial [Rhizobiaceae bacterium]
MRLTIKTKLAAVFTTVVALSGVSMFYALTNLGTLNEELTRIVNGPVQRSLAVKDLQQDIVSLALDSRKMIISSDPTELEAIRTEMDGIFNDASANLQKLSGAFSLAQSNEDIKTITDHLAQYRNVMTRMQDQAMQNSEQQAFLVTTQQGSPAITEIETQLGDLRQKLAD